VNAEADIPTVEMSADSAAALRERGGNLYVWTDGAGIPVARTKPSNAGLTYTTTRSDEGWAVHIDSSLVHSLPWLIKWTRFPWPHFKAIYGPQAAIGGYRLGWSDVIAGIVEAIWRW
jgi:hypothetical protein